MNTNHLIRSCIFGLLAAISLSVMAIFVKLAAPHTTNSITILFRFAVGLVYVLGVYISKRMRGIAVPLKTKKFHLHFARALFGVLSMLMFYYSLEYLSLANGTVLVMTAPLFVPVLLLLLFRQKTQLEILLFIVVGFIGVIFVLNPDAGVIHKAAWIGLMAGFSAALALIFLRKAVQHDSPFTVLMYYFPMAVIMSAIISIFDWQTPNLTTLGMLLCVGIFGTAYQEFLVRASKYAPPTIISSLMYTAIVFGGFFDWLFWGEVPALNSALGMVLVCLAGSLVVLHSKRKLPAKTVVSAKE